MATRDEDFVEHLFTASTHDYLLFFTASGRVHWLKVYEIPPASRTAQGRAITNLLQISNEEKIAALIRVRKFDQGGFIMLATEKGVVKKTELSEYSHPRADGIIAVTVDQGDLLIGAALTNGEDEILLVTANGMAIRFHEKDVRPMGRTARGVRGIRLKKKGDKVVGMEKVLPDHTLLVVSEKGFGKRTDFEEYRVQGRGGGGLITLRTGARIGALVGAASVRAGDGLMLISASGQMIRMAIDEIRTIGRATSGVRLFKLDGDDTLVSLAKVIEEAEGEEGEGEKAPE
jgi:DNA gyrase subunit A